VGLSYLKDMKSLRKLDLPTTKVTDAGLKYLTELTALEKLFCPGEETTKEGVHALRLALPNTEIKR